MKKVKGKMLVKNYEVPMELNVNENYNFVPGSSVSKSVREVLKYLKKVGELNFEKYWVRYDGGGGSSIDVYLYGADEETYKKVKDLSWMFRSGSFNGMFDIYEYKDNRTNFYGDDGNKYEATVMYVFVNNEAPFDTPEYENKYNSTLKDNFVGV